MSLVPGTRLGPHAILAAIGAAGPPPIRAIVPELQRDLAEARRRIP
jgi:hypothetical protein